MGSLKNKKLFVIPPSLGPFGLRPYPAPLNNWHGSCFAPSDPAALAIAPPCIIGRIDPVPQAADPSGGPPCTENPAGERVHCTQRVRESLAIMTQSTENPAGEGITQRVTGAGESWPVRQL
jgi:hypothetical protein